MSGNETTVAVWLMLLAAVIIIIGVLALKSNKR